MATLLSSLFALPNCVDCRAIKSSKLIVSNHENQINHRSGRTETERNSIAGESMLSVTKTTRHNPHKVYAMSGASVKQSERIPTTSTEVEDSIKASTDLFRTEIGDLVNVSVERKNGQCVVFIEVSSLQLSKNGSKLVLSWGIFGSDSSYLVPSDSKKSTPDGIIQTNESSFVETSTGSSMKEVVKELHANGIEVLLEVVVTHTADGALQGNDDSSYYFGDQTADVNLKARNVLNCNFPVVQQMILDSLRY